MRFFLHFTRLLGRHDKSGGRRPLERIWVPWSIGLKANGERFVSRTPFFVKLCAQPVYINYLSRILPWRRRRRRRRRPGRDRSGRSGRRCQELLPVVVVGLVAALRDAVHKLLVLFRYCKNERDSQQHLAAVVFFDDPFNTSFASSPLPLPLRRGDLLEEVLVEEALDVAQVHQLCACAQ